MISRLAWPTNMTLFQEHRKNKQDSESINTFHMEGYIKSYKYQKSLVFSAQAFVSVSTSFKTVSYNVSHPRPTNM